MGETAESTLFLRPAQLFFCAISFFSGSLIIIIITNLTRALSAKFQANKLHPIQFGSLLGEQEYRLTLNNFLARTRHLRCPDLRRRLAGPA